MWYTCGENRRRHHHNFFSQRRPNIFLCVCVCRIAMFINAFLCCFSTYNFVCNSRRSTGHLFAYTTIPSIGPVWNCQMFHSSVASITICYLDQGSSTIRSINDAERWVTIKWIITVYSSDAWTSRILSMYAIQYTGNGTKF